MSARRCRLWVAGAAGLLAWLLVRERLQRLVEGMSEAIGAPLSRTPG